MTQGGQQSVPILLYANQRLLEMGVPRINVTETFALEPLILVAGLLSLFLLGPTGLVFTGVIWIMFSVQSSQGNPAVVPNNRPGPMGPGPGRPPRWGGQGHVLGRR